MRRERHEDVLPLAGVQRWMQAVVVHRGDVRDAVASPDAERELPAERVGELIRPSRSLTSLERVEIYQEMYPLRMVEALETDYPALKRTLGDDGFERLVLDYVQVFPSRSYTLNRLGDHMPEFLAEHSGLSGAAFLADLARLELAITAVFDEAETPVLSSERLGEVSPDAWAGARLRPIAALRLLALRHRVLPHLDATREDRRLPQPVRKPSWIVIYRREFSVLRLELTRVEFDLLSALVEGAPLADAIGRVAAQLRASRREKAVFRWFREWVAQGLFSAVEV